MKRVMVSKVKEESHGSMSDRVLSNLDQLDDSYIAMRLDDLLKERGLTQKDLANMTGLRVATVSEILNGKGTSFNLIQLLTIVVALRLTSFDELFTLEMPEDVKRDFEAEAEAKRVW